MDDLELLMLLPPPLEFWDHRCILQVPGWLGVGYQTQALVYSRQAPYRVSSVPHPREMIFF